MTKHTEFILFYYDSPPMIKGDMTTIIDIYYMQMFFPPLTKVERVIDSVTSVPPVTLIPINAVPPRFTYCLSEFSERSLLVYSQLM